MPSTTFIRLLAAVDKAVALAEAIAALRNGAPSTSTYAVDPASFRQVPGSPFAYWVSEEVRGLFSNLSTYASSGSEVRLGLHTCDDFRFVRAAWEVPAGAVVSGPSNASPDELRRLTFENRRWVPLSKGGSYSPYYADIHLCVNWQDDGYETKQWASSRFGSWSRLLQSASFYFRPGLTYPRRSQRGFSVRVMPSGAIFSEKGPAVFDRGDGANFLAVALALLNSAPAKSLFALQMAFGSYEVGVITRSPLPEINADTTAVLASTSREAHDLKRDADRDDEVTHPFTTPALVRLREQPTLAAASKTLVSEDAAREKRLVEIQRQVDDHCFALYGFSKEDRAQVERGDQPATSGGSGSEDAGEGAGEDGLAGDTDDEEIANSGKTGNASRLPRITADLLMYAVGCAFGRWDVRIGRDPSLAPRLGDPFAPLPVCAPAALVGPDGLPATSQRIASDAWLHARPDAITLPPEGSVAKPVIAADYPLEVAWDGILVDDPDAPDDLVRRIRLVLEYLWGARAEAIEVEACSILGMRDLRDYVRNPRAFFDFHIGRYSKSRRKAPIYWLLQSPKRNYGIWLYYHRLDADLAFKALNFHLLPKIRLEEGRLDDLKVAKQQAGTSGAMAHLASVAIERQGALLADLREFRDAFDRAARHYFTPDLHDGVLLNVAPFREVVPWKEAKAAWEQLLAGRHEWSSIGKQLREKGK